MALKSHRSTQSERNEPLTLIRFAQAEQVESLVSTKRITRRGCSERQEEKNLTPHMFFDAMQFRTEPGGFVN